MSLEIILLLCSINRLIVGFPRPIVYQSEVLDHFSRVMNVLQLSGVGLKNNFKKWLVIPGTTVIPGVCATLVPVYLQASLCGRLQGLSDIDNYFTFLLMLKNTFSTMNSSQ